MPIITFRGKHGFLSNFAACKILYNGIEYPTVEHAYQAVKSLDVNIRKYVANLPTPVDAKKYAHKMQVRDDWPEIKASVMYQLLKLKFSQEIFKNKLLSTKNEIIVEGNTWHDTFWGCCYCEKHTEKGENKLGKLLMQIRKEIQNDMDNNSGK